MHYIRTYHYYPITNLAHTGLDFKNQDLLVSRASFPGVSLLNNTTERPSECHVGNLVLEKMQGASYLVKLELEFILHTYLQIL
jgi:hypothetical protein